MRQNVMTMFRCFNHTAGQDARRNPAVGAFHRNPSRSAHSLSAKNSLLRMILVCLLVGGTTVASAQTTIQHYTGVSNKPLKDYTGNGHQMQQVAEYHYYYYVKDKNDVVNFTLPFENWPNSTSNLEPSGYFRWYNYKNDNLTCTNGAISVYSSSGKLKTVQGVGLVAYGLDPTTSTRANIGATYTPNSSMTIDESWEGDIVACDVSRYTDYTTGRITSTYEKCTYGYNHSDDDSYANSYTLTTDRSGNVYATNQSKGSNKRSDDNDGKHGKYIYETKEVVVTSSWYSQGRRQNVSIRTWVDLAENDANCKDHTKKTVTETVTTVTKEPTLSIRYVFHILPVSKLANQWKKAVVDGVTGTDANRNLTYDDNKRIIVGYKNDASEFNIRLNLDRDITDYYCYGIPEGWIGGNYQDAFYKKHVYYPEDSKTTYQIAESDFDGEMRQLGNQIVWRIYDETKTKRMDLYGDGNSKFLTLSINKLKQGTWGSLTDGYLSSSKVSVPTSFNKVYVVAYAKASNYYCPIANFEVQFVKDQYPKTRTEIANTERSLETLENSKAYTEVAVIDFDFDEASASEPANSNENHYKGVPENFEDNAYSYVYNPSAFSTLTQNTVSSVTHSPLHGDYGYYKVANLGKNASGGYSDNAGAGYTWHSSAKLKDYTYNSTGQYGYFLYLDAANESRKITTAKFKAELCGGNQIVFSGHAAEMTYSGNAQKVQIMFKLYGINTSGEKVLIQSFSSGDISTNTTNYKEGEWYQVYGSFVLPEGCDSKVFKEYAIDIVNMCSATNGADYAIDQINVFTRTAAVDVVPSQVLCPEDKASDVSFKIRAVYETLKGKIEDGQTNIYYQFREVDSKGSDKAAEGIDYDNNGKKYGVATLPTTTPDNLEDGIYYIIANKNFALSEDKLYYLSINFSDPETYPANWGKEGTVCDIYSDRFSNMRRGLNITGEQEVSAGCGKDAKKQVKVKVNVTYRSYNTTSGQEIALTNVKFDWYVYPKGGTFSSAELTSQIQKFHQSYTDWSDTYASSYPKMAAAIANTNAEGKLYVSSSNIFDQELEVGDWIVEAIPTASTTTVSGKEEAICDGLTFNISVTGGDPELIFGQTGVTYPEDYKRVVRIGLKQIAKATAANGGVVNLPVQGMTKGGLTMTEMTFLVDETNDNSFTGKGTTTVANTQNKSSLEDTETQLPIQFVAGAETMFHEGYYYVMNLQIKKLNGKETDCIGTASFILKVVPEYLTWTGSDNNANWNNDSNWKRSTKDEIFKESYTESPEGAAGAYVPMKFSKVTVKEFTGSDNKYYPALNTVKTGDKDIITEMKDKYEYGATENIQYDLMVAWDKTYAEQAGTSTGSYNCEPFYANTCEQIYFKPRAELLGQQYLTYEKAWVEKELTPKSWSLMASPLQETYAGDMYVPYATGQQKTEAFQTISWGSNCSRNNYPFYQKNWDRSGTEVAAGSSSWEAYDKSTPNTDVTQDEVKYAVGYWSHVYNKVDEKYDGAKAFVVKAGDEYHPSSSTSVAKTAIVRLPKADNSYNYYEYNGTSSSVSGTTTKTANAHKFVVTETDGSFTETLNTNSTTGNQYYLVGNPYTASLNVKAFLEGNSSNFDASGIWTLNNGTMEAKTVGENTIIEPMGAFFVKAANDTKPSTASFTSEMTVDGHNGSASTNPAKTRASETFGEDETIVLTASSAKSSMATCASVIVRSDAYAEYENGEDVETLYNGDLDDAPTVYTVASNQAVSVNAVPSMELIPMGVVSKESEDVTIAFSKADNVDVYLFDAKTKTSTLLYSGDSITVQSNAHGRYYLSSKAIDINDRTNNDVKVYSPANGIITVATAMSDVMQSAEVFSADGKKVAQEAVNGESSKDFYVSGGLYIVKVTTSNGVKTQKVAVK